MRGIFLVIGVISLFSCKKELKNEENNKEMDNFSLLISNLSYSQYTRGAIQYVNEKKETITYNLDKLETQTQLKVYKGEKIRILGVGRYIKTSIGTQGIESNIIIQLNGVIIQNINTYSLNVDIN